MIRAITLASCVMISGLAYAGADRGHFDSDRFTSSIEATEPAAVGNGKYAILTNGQVSSAYVKQMVADESATLRQFLEDNGYAIRPLAFTNHKIVIKIISISDLNDPRYFDGTNQECKAGIHADPKKCDGFFMGRTFYVDGVLYSPITVYIGYSSGKDYAGEYSFKDTLRHELFHALIARFDLKYRLGSDAREHTLLEQFIKYMDDREKTLGKKMNIR